MYVGSVAPEVWIIIQYLDASVTFVPERWIVWSINAGLDDRAGPPRGIRQPLDFEARLDRKAIGEVT